jgi:hypothetical protein
MAEELKSLRESLSDVDALNASWDVKEYIKNEIAYAIMCLEFAIEG